VPKLLKPSAPKWIWVVREHDPARENLEYQTILRTWRQPGRTSRHVATRKGFGILRNLGMGLIGAVVGGLLFRPFGLFQGLDAVVISLRDIVAACERDPVRDCASAAARHAIAPGADRGARVFGGERLHPGLPALVGPDADRLAEPPRHGGRAPGSDLSSDTHRALHSGQPVLRPPHPVSLGHSTTKL
jgi:hypothetical protein